MKAAIYCRVSTEEQAKEGFSISAQKKTLLSFCELKNWSVANIYIDEGISGKSTKRPAFMRMLKDAALGQFQVILVWKINRFSRKNSDLLNTVEYLMKHEVNLVSYSEQFDAATPSGKLMLSMLGSIGEFERDTIVENIRAGMVERAEQGLFNGGRVLGYDTCGGRLVINKKEASTVRRIFDLYFSGNGYNNICRILKEENRATKNNCTFQINSIKRILKNPIYAGYITYNKADNDNTVYTAGIHERIVSKARFHKAQEIMNSKRQLYCCQNSYILTPVLKCPYCGSKMTGHTGNRKNDGSHYRYYLCTNSKCRNPELSRPCRLNAEKTENKVIDSIQAILLQEKIFEDILKHIKSIHNNKNSEYYNELDSLKRELSGKKKSLEKYMIFFESSCMDTEVFKKRISDISSEVYKIEQRIELINRRLKAEYTDISYEKVNFIATHFKSFFSRLDNLDKKRIISCAIKQIKANAEPAGISITYNFPVLIQIDARYSDSNIKYDINT